MTERSYNGWPASEHLVTRVIEPVKGVKLRVANNANVEAVFDYLCVNFHRRVDKITEPHPADDWGYSYRPNKNNPSELSNHASATAVDLDATEHPNGVPTNRTFTNVQIAEVHKILDELEGVVRWGGDYTHTVDAMHFEINVEPGHLQKIGGKIRRLKKKPGKNGYRLPSRSWKPAKKKS